MVLQASGLVLLEVWVRGGTFARVDWKKSRDGACGVATRLISTRWGFPPVVNGGCGWNKPGGGRKMMMKKHFIER